MEKNIITVTTTSTTTNNNISTTTTTTITTTTTNTSHQPLHLVLQIKRNIQAESVTLDQVANDLGLQSSFNNPMGGNSVANKMMKQMGWTGGGLGKKGEGITEPIRCGNDDHDNDDNNNDDNGHNNDNSNNALFFLLCSFLPSSNPSLLPSFLHPQAE